MMLYNNPSISPTQKQQTMSPQFNFYEQELYSTSPPQEVYGTSLSPQLDMVTITA